MRTTLRSAYAALLAFAFLAAPVLAQEPGGDAPDGTTAAQDAFGQNPLAGDLETTSDVDCFAIYINDPAAFGATTVGGPDDGLDSKLYLWNGTVTGATTGIAFNDDAIEGLTLLSRLPVGDPLLTALSPGKYVLCITSYDNDPLNAAGLDIFSQGSPFTQTYPPNPTDGDAALASWDNPGFGDTGPYSIALTGTGDNPGNQCSLSLSGADISPNSVAAGGTVTFSGSVVQAGPGQKAISLRATYDGPGSLNGSLNLGAASNVPPGTYPFSRPVRVPANAPSGSYVVTLQVINSGTGEVCDDYTETITVTAPRLSGEATEVAEPVAVARVKGTPRPAAAVAPPLVFEVIAPGAPLFEASATTTSSAVSPNPFARRTQISYAVETTSQVRLSVYDVLGREVAVLVDGTVEAGQHAATFDARGLAAGTYVYRLSVGNDVQTGRMTLAH